MSLSAQCPLGMAPEDCCESPIGCGAIRETDEMVERAARAWWAHESDSDVAWADVIDPVRNGYRARAREALAAASDDGETAA